MKKNTLTSKLTKSQKFMIIFWGLYELIMGIIAADERYNPFRLFLILSIPCILYWSGVWIWGFGYLFKLLLKPIKNKVNTTYKNGENNKKESNRILTKSSMTSAACDLSDLSKLSPEMFTKIITVGQIVVKSLINNLQYVPDKVLNIGYVKDAIAAYTWYYTMILYSKFKLPEEYRNLAFSAVLIALFEKGGIVCYDKRTIPFVSFNLDLMRDKRFILFPKTIELFINEKIENQTGLLVYIERYMEKITGQHTRYLNNKKVHGKKK